MSPIHAVYIVCWWHITVVRTDPFEWFLHRTLILPLLASIICIQLYKVWYLDWFAHLCNHHNLKCHGSKPFFIHWKFSVWSFCSVLELTLSGQMGYSFGSFGVSVHHMLSFLHLVIMTCMNSLICCLHHCRLLLVVSTVVDLYDGAEKYRPLLMVAIKLVLG